MFCGFPLLVADGRCVSRTVARGISHCGRIPPVFPAAAGAIYSLVFERRKELALAALALACVAAGTVLILLDGLLLLTVVVLGDNGRGEIRQMASEKHPGGRTQ